jgi:hypothetical protein
MRSNPLLTNVIFLGDGKGMPLIKGTGASFDAWLGIYRQASESRRDFAEMIAIGEDCVLRIHHSNGIISRQVIRGVDPLFLAINQDKFELLHFQFSFTPESQVGHVAIYLRALGAVQESEGQTALRALRKRLGGISVSIAIRSDGWFVYQAGYPYLNLFNQDSDPPTQESYDKTRTMVCSDTSERPRCWLE